MGDIADEDALRFCDGDPHEEDVELYGVFQHETDKAYLIRVDNKDMWFPRSQITGGDFEPERLTPGNRITFWIPAWLADKKGLA